MGEVSLVVGTQKIEIIFGVFAILWNGTPVEINRGEHFDLIIILIIKNEKSNKTSLRNKIYKI